MTLRLSGTERAMLAGDHGPAVRIAMRVLTRLGEIGGAERMVPIASAHVGGLLYDGRSRLDFARHLLAAGARVAVPTTLNSVSVDLRRPEAWTGDAATAELAVELAACYTRMGGRPTWTCAPYLLRDLPAAGEHVVWSESGAVVFANSVLGARTDRYGAMTDVCAAVAGRAPLAGLHLTANRAARVVVRLGAVPAATWREDHAYQLLGYLVGERAGSRVAAVEGLPGDVTDDQLRALCAAAATSGGLGLVHVVGVTPEAPTRRAACQDGSYDVVDVGAADLRDVAHRLGGHATPDGGLDAVCLGSPHFSLTEFRALHDLLRATGPAHAGTALLVTTNRRVAAELAAEGTDRDLAELGVRVLTDVCSYNTRVLPPGVRTVMTSSAKWAHYGPGNHGLRVVLGSLRDCVASAHRGRVLRDAGWGAGPRGD